MWCIDGFADRRRGSNETERVAYRSTVWGPQHVGGRQLHDARLLLVRASALNFKIARHAGDVETKSDKELECGRINKTGESGNRLSFSWAFRTSDAAIEEKEPRFSLLLLIDYPLVSRTHRELSRESDSVTDIVEPESIKNYIELQVKTYGERGTEDSGPQKHSKEAGGVDRRDGGGMTWIAILDSSCNAIGSGGYSITVHCQKLTDRIISSSLRPSKISARSAASHNLRLRRHANAGHTSPVNAPALRWRRRRLSWAERTCAR